MSFEHVGYAGGSVAVLGGELRQEGLGLEVQGPIETELRGEPRFNSCSSPHTNARRFFPSIGNELQDGIGVPRIQLLWHTKQRVKRSVVGPKHRQVGVLSVLFCSKSWAFPCFMDDATVGAATEWARAIPHAEVSESLGSRPHGQALRR